MNTQTTSRSNARRMLLVLITGMLLVGLGGYMDETTASTHTQPAAGERSESENSPGATGSSEVKDDTFEIQGTVRFKDLEGGFFAIEGDDGKKYEPMNLAEAFQKDGLRVRLRARLETDMMSFRMYGSLIEIMHIEVQ